MPLRRCGGVATDIGQQSEFALPARSETIGSGSSLKNQVERSLDSYPCAPEPCLPEDCKQLGGSRLRSQRIAPPLR